MIVDKSKSALVEKCNYIRLPNINNEQEYDETISFNHNFHYLRVFRESQNDKKKKEDDSFPLLVNDEFILQTGTNTSIEDDKNLSKMNLDDKEITTTIMNRIKQFTTTNDDTFKSLFLDNLTNYSQKLGLEKTNDVLIPVLSQIPHLSTKIKEKFFEIFSNFLDHLVSYGECSYKLISESLVKLLLELLNFDGDRVRYNQELVDLCCKNLIYLVKALKIEDRGNLILSQIINMANDDNEDTKIENRCLSCRLISDLANLFGTHYCEVYLVPQLSGLSDDQHFRIRKAVALCLAKVAEQVTYSIFIGKILPLYQTYSYFL
jgi:hypothetical protein